MSEVTVTRTGARERMRLPPSTEYAENVSWPVFEFNAAHYFRPLLDAHRAWAMMLHEQGTLDREDLGIILQAEHRSNGGTAPEEVRRMVREREAQLAEQVQFAADLRHTIEAAHERLAQTAAAMAAGRQ